MNKVVGVQYICFCDLSVVKQFIVETVRGELGIEILYNRVK